MVILTKTPLRISFVGGGSDRPSFYQEENGACVAAAIDKYIYVAVNEKYDGTIRAAYSITENVPTVGELQHELIREALKLTGRLHGVEVHSIADLPGGSGLGSSSAFTVGLLAALMGEVVPGEVTKRARAIGMPDPDSLEREARALELADMACQIEIDRCQKPIGKQDQYAAAFGGMRLYEFNQWGVEVGEFPCDMDRLSAHCLLLDTGLSRVGDAGAMLASQTQDRDDVRQLAELAQQFAPALSEGDLEMCGFLMDVGWKIKRQYCGSHQIDLWYASARKTGAWGGKLCGAGGGGFLLFLAPPERHAAIVQALGLRHVPIRVGVEGCRVVHHS